MQTLIAGSTVSTAAATGRLFLGSNDDGKPAVEWLAVARKAALCIYWVDDIAEGHASQPLDLANETELDDPIVALAAIPRG